MIKTNLYVRRRTRKDVLFKYIFWLLLIYIVLKSISIMSINLDMNITDKIKIQDINLYKSAINMTIPCIGSTKGKSMNIDQVLIQKFTGIDLSNLNSIIDKCIPIIVYANHKYGMDYNAVSESMPTLQQGEGVVFQNDEDYFEGINSDEISSVFSPIDSSNVDAVYTLNQMSSLEFLKKKLYFAERVTLSMDYFPVNEFMKKDLTVNLNTRSPKILIFHTHSQEAFIDSRPGKSEDTVVGVGDELANILSKKYNIAVVHDKGQYDVKNGELDRGPSYERMEPSIRKILKKYPSIEVMIDLHRDGVDGNINLVTEINNKDTARIMFVNGVCELKDGKGNMQPIKNLPNEYVEDNMAFSLRMELEAKKLYPGFARKIYLKPYRYSLHMRPKSLLVEVGSQRRTLQQAKNAMEPLADILYNVLTGKE